MKKRLLCYLTLGFLLLFLGSCSKEEKTPEPLPTAGFTVTGGDCIAPCEVTFTNTSINATSYQWNFGDGTTSTEQSPKHTYQKGGYYTVVLKATGPGGNGQHTNTLFVETPYIKVTVNKITVEKVSYQRPTGGSWDESTDPDLFLTITGPAPTTSIVFQQGDALALRNWAATLFPMTYTLNPAPTITSLGDTYRVNVYDSD